MSRYLLQRLLLLIPTTIGATMVVFAVMALSPGGPCSTPPENMDAVQRSTWSQECVKKHHLDQPLAAQYLFWLNGISPIGFIADTQGNLGKFYFKDMNLGTSIKQGQPVAQLLADRVPITLLLNLLSLPLVFLIAIWIGVKAASARGGYFDSISGITVLALFSIPVVLLGAVLLIIFTDQGYLGWFPTGGLISEDARDWPWLPFMRPDGFHRGYLLDLLWHLVLPIFCLSYAGLAFVSKQARSAMLENLNSNYARTARAKGLNEQQVLWQHVFRNSFLPLITIAGSLLPSLLAGSVIIETIFSINGMGQLIVEATFDRERDEVLSITLISTFLALLGRLIADVCYALADPRVTYD